MICKLPSCNSEFTPKPKAQHQKYCCKQHKFKHWSDQQKLNGVATSTEQLATNTQPTHKVQPKDYKPPVQLDVASTWVIEQQKENIKELKDEKRKLELKIETLFAEKTGLQKQLDKAEREAEKATSESNKKPSALNGFLENVASQPLEFMQALPAVIAGFKEAMKSSQPEQMQGIPAGQPASAHALDQWLAKQPENVRTQFTQLINTLMRYAYPQDLSYVLQQMTELTLRPTG